MDKMREGPREEQKQVLAGGNELCWTQLQQDDLYDTFRSKVLGSRRWPVQIWREGRWSLEVGVAFLNKAYYW